MAHTRRDGITYLSLCSGYDGIGRGLEIAGVRIAFTIHVEVETFAAWNLVSKIQAGAMGPGVLYPDVKTFPFGRFRGTLNLLSAGFPCQPFSHAGKGAADEDPRHLFPFIKRGIEAACPDWVFLENVDGLVSRKLAGDGWTDPPGTPILLHVLRELERTGYEATWGVFSAAEVGAPHQRKRVFILAKRLGPGVEPLLADGCAEPSFPISGMLWPARPGRGQWWWEPLRVLRGGKLDDPMCYGFSGHEGGDEAIPGGDGPENGVSDTPGEANRTESSPGDLADELVNTEHSGHDATTECGEDSGTSASGRPAESEVNGESEGGCGQIQKGTEGEKLVNTLGNGHEGGCEEARGEVGQGKEGRLSQSSGRCSQSGPGREAGQLANPDSGGSRRGSTSGTTSDQGRETSESGRTGLRAGRSSPSSHSEPGSQADEELAHPDGDGRHEDGQGDRAGPLAAPAATEGRTGDSQTTASVSGSGGPGAGGGEQSEGLAHSDGSGREKSVMQSAGLPTEPGRGCTQARQDVADAKGRESGQQAEQEGRQGAGGGSEEELVNPDNSRSEECTVSRKEGRTPKRFDAIRTSSGGRGQDVADAKGKRMEGQRQSRKTGQTDRRWPRSNARTDCGEIDITWHHQDPADLPDAESGGQPVCGRSWEAVAAMGGDDDALAGRMGYADLLESKIVEAVDVGNHELAEALERELFRFALSRSVDSRTDELRLLGNGVVPPCAAKAFTILYGDITKEVGRA